MYVNDGRMLRKEVEVKLLGCYATTWDAWQPSVGRGWLVGSPWVVVGWWASLVVFRSEVGQAYEKLEVAFLFALIRLVDC